MAKKAMQYREARRQYASQVRNRCVPSVVVRVVIFVVLAYAEFVFVNWHFRARSLVSSSLHGKRVEVIA